MQRTDDTQPSQQPATGPVVYRVLVAVGVAVLALGLLGLVSYAIHIFLTAFAAVLFGVFLSTPAVWLEHYTRLSYRWALAAVVAALVGLAVALTLLIGLTLWQQVQELGRALPQSVAEARQQLSETSWGRWLLEAADNQADPPQAKPKQNDRGQGSKTPREADQGEQHPNRRNEPAAADGAAASQRAGSDSPGEAPPGLENVPGGLGQWGMTMLTGVGGAAYQMMHFVAALVVIVFAGFYFASEPQWYQRGLVLLAPPAKRDRAHQVLDELRTTLRWWIVGQLVSMTVVGLIWGVGLWLLGVKLALVLGLLAFLAELVPFLGPLVAAIPAFLLAATQSEVNLLYVLLLYLALQTAESYVVQPLVQEQAVRLPPAITILAVMLLSYLGGLLGALLAAPLTVTAIVLVRMLYVEDTLGDKQPTASD